jgi:hypothetical protein
MARVLSRSPCARLTQAHATATALFSKRLHFVRKERIGIEETRADDLLTKGFRLSPVIASDAKQIHLAAHRDMDCFASVAMTIVVSFALARRRNRQLAKCSANDSTSFSKNESESRKAPRDIC